MSTRIKVLAILVGTALSFLTLPAYAAAVNLVEYDDPLGDACDVVPGGPCTGTAPDFSGLSVRNYVDGEITFAAEVANRSNFESGDDYDFALDTDRNPATGPTGADWRVLFQEVAGTSEISVDRWNENAHDFQSWQIAQNWGWSQGPFVSFKMADLGLRFGDSFDFYLLSEKGSEADFAPGGAGSVPPLTWSFHVERVPDCGLDGSQGPDVLTGTTGHDYICGHRGKDEISGFAGADRLLGGDGPDLLRGGSGADVLRGGEGRDLILAGGGHDRIYARNGSIDTIRCGNGNDVVVSDAKDRLIGC